MNDKRTLTNTIAHLFLQFLAANYNFRPSFRKYLKSEEGWINFTLGIRTENRTVAQAIQFKDGKARVLSKIPDRTDSALIFKDDSIIKKVAGSPPNELMNYIMTNQVIPEGNLAYTQLFSFYLSLLLKNQHIRLLKKAKAKQYTPDETCTMPETSSRIRQKKQLECENTEPGVRFLKDPYLSGMTLDDFPRLKQFLDIHFKVKPAICHERPQLLTRWHMENGFEKDRSGEPWNPELRQAHAFRYLMENRKPIVRENDLLAGTTTEKEIGVVLYPDAQGILIWGELLTTPYRLLNPYDVEKETIDILHHDVFPYWIDRNFRQWVRDHKGYPLCQKLDERFAVYFLWKTVALSHTILDYPKLFHMGTKGIINEIDEQMRQTPPEEMDKLASLQAMRITLEGLNAYARNLSHEAFRLANGETDMTRKNELVHLFEILKNVPENPCETLDEAVNALWIVWVGAHMENTNAGLSLGRLDQWLQPFFEKDMERLSLEEERNTYIRHAVELIGCFYMRCTDHLPLIPDIGNYLFGGSSSDQAITLGGVKPDGSDAVNDMTYIFLKVTEMLTIRDPNVNARYSRGKNSDTYLKRLSEVNLNTTATPSIHNDEAVMTSLEEFNYPIEHLRDWSATGCVEPTLSGRHIGHTNCMMFNMVAALEMALNNGEHPLMRWQVGPETGEINKGAFPAFEDFFEAFCKQFDFLAGQACQYNNFLGEAHQYLRPTPYLSSMIDGCIQKGMDATKGGALYNSSGSACIGLADVTDSLMAVKQLVYEEKTISFPEFLNAINSNFVNRPDLLARLKNRVPLFGSGNKDALEMANRITKFAHDNFGKRKNYRGGAYTAGFWSMSNHVAFGTLTGALPSGRLKGKAFTPGLTPEAHASKNILDNIRDVSMLEPRHMNNNIAFNVKVVPSAEDSHEQAVDHIYSYAKAYCDMGGMQMQFNVVSTDTLKDAMAHPESYQNLLVRISGYNAYFVTLNRDMQMELIARAEFGL
ncbi:MAG: formate acetyltransferase [Proteobacteria bacterium]|nr:formate acetyltransferase [Pseudomonadota bacterium]